MIVDSNAELALALPAEGFQPVSADCTEILDRGRRIEPNEPGPGLLLDMRKFPHAFAIQQLVGTLVGERLDHTS